MGGMVFGPFPRIAVLFLMVLGGAMAEPPKEGGELVVVENQVDRSPATTAWTKAALGDAVGWQEQVRTGELSRAGIELSTGGVLRLSELTSLRLQPPKKQDDDPRSRINFTKGAAYFFSRTEKEADIETPTASLNIRGTEFVLEVGANGTTTVTMIDGAVGLSNALGAIDLSSGEQGIAEPGRAPRKTAVLDATEDIQFFLYYPGIVDPAGFDGLGAAFGPSRKAYADGDLLKALELLPQPVNVAEFQFAAAVKLASGRIDEVDEDLRRAGAGPMTDSLRLLIDVVKKPAAEMIDAVAPATPEGRLAISYVHQSAGDLEGALAAAKEAVGQSPEFGLAWARVAELEFGFGRNDLAETAVDRALALSPRNAQAIALKGFLALSRSRIPEAREWFAAALEIDPALGNAWLGQGLAFYQSSMPDEALRSITIAAAVEPNRAFLRSYLGKAFAESDKDDRALHELGLARRFDPGDPTAPLYQALLEQRLSQYNRGIANLEKSVELNDNRAVYRSGFLLDKDRAVREANLASLYENVGMTETSLEEARRSVVSDYLNPSAHLFLSNSVDALRDPRRVSLRYETPWFNELLLANLFSPAGTDLLAQNISQQEYTALFPENPFGFSTRTRYRGDGEFLSTGTAQGRFGRSSVALDYDLFTASGDRPNRDIERYTGYLQFKQALSERDSLYFNFKFQRFRGGDLRQLYDPTTFDPDYRVEQEQSPVAIVGYQHEWSPGSRTLALGGMLSDRLRISDKSATSFAMFIDPMAPAVSPPLAFPSDIDQLRETEVYFGELQHVWSDERQTFLVGTRFDWGRFETENILSMQPIFGILPGDPFYLNASPDYRRWVAYAYYTRELVNGLWATLGLAYDTQDYPLNTSVPPVSMAEGSRSELLPKAGLVWTPCNELTFRLGYARSLGGATFDESVRLEPTQVAGFTQSFRTLINESEVGGLSAPLFDTAGASVLWKLPCRTYLGAEGFFRRAEAVRGVGVLGIDVGTFAYDRVLQVEEDLEYEEYGGSLHATKLIDDEWSIGSRYTVTRAELQRSFPAFTAAGIGGFSSDQSSELHDAEAYIIYNHPSGWYGRLSGRFLSQDNGGYTPARPGDSWTQIDCAIGKRFFHNRASVEAGVLNLTDRDYRFNPLITLPEQPRERTFYLEVRADF
ncbi:hypothetical protein Hhel01_03835 [Haloferula helveola]